MLWAGIAVALAAVALTLSLKESTGLQWIFSGLTVGSIYALIAMGFSIIYSSTRVINFAQGEFSMLGGMFLYTFSGRAGLPLALGFLLSILTVTLIGAGFERIAVRPLRRKPVLTVIIVTIGFAIFLRASAKWVWGSNPVKVAPFTGEEPLRFLGASFSPQSFWVFALTALAVILIFVFFNLTLTGKGMRAAAENPDAASMVGISTSMSSLTAWTLAAALGAAAGMVIGPINFPTFDAGALLGLKGFTAAVIGGIGYAPGAVVGGLGLGVLEMIVAGVGPTGPKDAVAFVILILVLLIRPQGLFGKSEEVKV